MSDSDEVLTVPVDVKKIAWAENRPKKKDMAYYTKLTIQQMLDGINTRTISLLAIDVKSRKLIAVSRETMEEALKNLNIGPKVLARRLNAMSDILLATDQ